MENMKCVMVIDEALPLGIAMNTAAVLGISLGKKIPDCVGVDVKDQDGHNHSAAFPVEGAVPENKGDGRHGRGPGDDRA